MTAQMTSDERYQAYSQDEYDAACVIAKHALTYISRFKTPPTPEVYEIWYRFAEGSNPALNQQLAFAVNELESVGRNWIQRLHQEFFGRSEASDDLTNDLAVELGGLESMIRTQITISDEFHEAVRAVGENLHDDANPAEVRGCVAAVLATNESMQKQLRELKSQLEFSQANVESLRAQFLGSQKSLQTDPLTGVGNRRLFDSLLKQSIEDFPKLQSSRILLLVDLDNFKSVNDPYGHAAGDEVLRYVASEMQRLAPDASITRYGGDEFAAFISCDETQHGLALANGFCDFFAKNQLTMRRTGETLGHVTLSIGVAILRSDDTSDSWFDRADKLLYSAKQSGRCRVMAERKLDCQLTSPSACTSLDVT